MWPRKADVADFARFLGVHRGLQRGVGRKDAVGIVQANHLMELHQVNVVRLQPRQAFVELLVVFGFGAPVVLGHQEHFLPIAARCERLAHAYFAFALVVVPAIVHEVDAPVNGGMDEADAFLFGVLLADMEPAQADKRHLLTRAAQRPVQHIALARTGGRFQRAGSHGGGRARVRVEVLRPGLRSHRQPRRARGCGAMFHEVASCRFHALSSRLI